MERIRTWSHGGKPRARMGALLALVGLLALAGCASAGASPTSTSRTPLAQTKATTPSTGQQLPISSPTDGPALKWQAVNTPPGFTPRLASTNILAPSPAVEGDPTHVTAYACDEPLTGDATPVHPTFWATHDGGAHWAQMPLPASVTGWCNVIPDQNNTQNVLLGLSTEPPLGGPPTPDSYYVSFDGGASIQAVPSLRGKHALAFATVPDRSYVLLPDQEGGLELSRDGMHTWHAINPPTSASGSLSAFWPDQHDFALVVVEHTSTRDILYTADQDGQGWKEITGPGVPSGNFIASASASDNGQPWQLCGVSTDASATPAVSTLACSTDIGQTWLQRARWTQGPVPRTLVVTSSGTLYGTTAPAPGSSSASSGYPIYELAPYSATWEQRGLAAQMGLAYTPTNALLWAIPVPEMGSSDPQGRIFVASVVQ